MSLYTALTISSFDGKYETSYFITTVMFAISVTIYEMLAIQLKYELYYW